MCEHQVLLTLRNQEYEAFREVLGAEMNCPYGIVPKSLIEQMYIAKFVVEIYYDDNFGGEDYEPVWEIVRDVRRKFYDEFGMDTAYGYETAEINRKTDEAMANYFDEQYKITGNELFAKARELVTY